MTGTTLDAPLVAPSISPMRRSWRRYRAGILFVLPALVLYLVFMVYPFFQSIYFSLTSWNGVTADSSTSEIFCIFSSSTVLRSAGAAVMTIM